MTHCDNGCERENWFGAFYRDEDPPEDEPDDRDDGPCEFGPEWNADGTCNTKREDALYRHAEYVYEYDRD
jgi:hypothetical protein